VSRRYRVPFSLPLEPRHLVGPRHPFSTLMGWQPTSVRYYYLARNAIWHGLKGLGLSPGDVVLMPAYCHGVEIDVLEARGLVPRFYPVREDLQVDWESVASLATPEVRALYVIHYLGVPQPIPTIRALAEAHGLALIEDCALSLFSRAPEGPLGSFGDFSLFCLYKTLPLPHGGILAWKGDASKAPPEPSLPDGKSTAVYLAHRLLDGFELAWSPWGGDRLVAGLRALGSGVKRGTGTTTVAIDTDHFEQRFADLGVSPTARGILERVDAAEIVRRRRANLLRLRDALPGGVRPVFTDLPEGLCPLSFPIFVPDKEALQPRLSEAGVGSVNMWRRFHRSIPVGAYPSVAFLRDHLLELPVHQGLEPRHIDYVAERAGELARWK
jgi:dTDP-4-amino-4,6-dideoxygalactose transaminase